VDISKYTRKDIGNLGEKVACEYLRRKEFEFVDKNVARKTGEIDLVMQKGETLHFIEVKTVLCREFPQKSSIQDEYGPEVNLHANKIRKVIRTAEWYIAENGWEGEWQVDGALVWMRSRDGICRVEYLPQIS
jgi:putative endonuclease